LRTYAKQPAAQVAVGEGVGVCVIVAEEVAVPDAVAVPVSVAVPDSVAEEVAVLEAVGVPEGVRETDEVPVALRVAVAVVVYTAVPVADRVAVEDGGIVAVGTAVGTAVGVDVGVEVFALLVVEQPASPAPTIPAAQAIAAPMFLTRFVIARLSRFGCSFLLQPGEHTRSRTADVPGDLKEI